MYCYQIIISVSHLAIVYRYSFESEGEIAWCDESNKNAFVTPTCNIIAITKKLQYTCTRVYRENSS